MKTFPDKSVINPLQNEHSLPSLEPVSKFLSTKIFKVNLRYFERQFPFGLKIGIPLAALTLGTAALFSFKNTGIIEKQLKESDYAQARQIAAVVEAELRNHPSDEASMNQFLQNLKSAKLSINNVRVYRSINGHRGLWASADPTDITTEYVLEDKDKQPLVYGRPSEVEDTAKEQLEVDLPLRLNGKVTAAVGIYIDLKPRHQATKSSIQQISIHSLLGAIVEICFILLILF